MKGSDFFFMSLAVVGKRCERTGLGVLKDFTLRVSAWR
jgi:hypothetical protein